MEDVYISPGFLDLNSKNNFFNELISKKPQKKLWLN